MLVKSHKINWKNSRSKYHKDPEIAPGAAYACDGSRYDLDIFMDDRRFTFVLTREEVEKLHASFESFLKSTPR